jgi:hypothetical protein
MNRWIGLHLDLSEFPPTPERLLSLFRPLSNLGLDTLLLEPGPMFPWSIDERFRCENAYPESLFGPLLASAEREAVRIVPMLDCFSRMSFVLRHRAYRHLRFSGRSADRVEPTAPGARGFIETLLDDLLEILPGVRSLHLGGFRLARAADSISSSLSEKELDEFLFPIVTYLLERDVRPIVSERVIRGVPDGLVLELSRLCSIQLDIPASYDSPEQEPRGMEHAISYSLSSAPSLIGTVTLVRGSAPARACGFVTWNGPDRSVTEDRVRLSGVMLVASGGDPGDPGGFPPRETAWGEITSAVLALRTGSIPSSDETERALERAGFDPVHREVRKRFDDFLSLLNEAWALVRRARERIAGATADPALRSSIESGGPHETIGLHSAVEAAEHAGADLACMFERLCEMPQVRRFVADRVFALREEALLIDSRMIQLGES